MQAILILFAAKSISPASIRSRSLPYPASELFMLMRNLSKGAINENI
ncbi:Uncharacterized protein {ECO:0000313/EMBL:CCF09660.1} [Pantoea ananatis]|nr:Uncharacterized protein {ECO:0000313/EMBL:CCF09660.1} [Pantoea ananatis]